MARLALPTACSALAAVPAACLLLLAGPAVLAQPGASSTSFADRWVAADAPLVLHFEPDAWRELLAARDRLRLFVGKHDLSALVRVPAPGRLEVGGNVAWPSGESEVVLYLVQADMWQELGRWPLRVRTPAGFESSSFEPRLELRFGGRAAERRSDGQPVTPRGTHGDASARGGVAFTGQRDGWQLDAAAQGQAASFRGEALRFATLGLAAPRADLAEYRLAATHGRFGARVGHAEFGRHPLLMNAFAARGLGVSAPLGARFDLALHAASGSQIVGTDNLSGVEEREHRIQGASVGAELGRGWRLEVSGLEARQAPITDFAAGSVADAERSRGLGWRLHRAAGRLRVDAAWARSRHEHPFDTALAQGGPLVAVAPATRDAHRVEVQADVLAPREAAGAAAEGPAAAAGGGTGAPADAAHAPPTLTLTALHERSAPLYRSLAAVISGDQLHGRVGATAAWRGASLTLAAGRREDNLARIATLLATRTEERTASLALPLPRWLGESGAGGEGGTGGAWPQVSLSAQRAHQFALNTPLADDSGFAETHRPDQVTAQAQGQLVWSFAGGAALSTGATLSRVDNRQVGRENADFDTLAHQASLGLPLAPTLRARLAGQRSRQLAREIGLANVGEAASLGLDWQPTPKWTLGAQASGERNDAARQEIVQVHVARAFEVPNGTTKLAGQVSLRATAQQSRPLDPAAGARLRQGWVDLALTIQLP
ncbi:MAG: hypothetical protein KIT17_12550 [Rubrivivax sp.]|nr:hypothetical protein [Rubrivivax sp.]